MDNKEKITDELVVDALFNVDLKFNELIIKNFTPKVEYEFTGMWGKLGKKIMNGDETILFDYEAIGDNVPFDIAEKISNWLEINTNVNDILIPGADIMRKVQLFCNVYFDYLEYKKKLKK